MYKGAGKVAPAPFKLTGWDVAGDVVEVAVEVVEVGVVVDGVAPLLHPAKITADSNTAVITMNHLFKGFFNFLLLFRIQTVLKALLSIYPYNTTLSLRTV